MKNLKINILFVGIICLFSCTQYAPQPQAEIGWGGRDQMVRVTDNTGQQFLINYLLYQQLFASGGYNNVVHYYYSNPSGRGIYSGNTRFTGGKPLANFGNSYRSSVLRKSVYRPTYSNISRARRSATYIRASRIYSSKPSISSFRSSSRSFSSPSRSSYRSSYRSSFRSGRR